MSLNLKLLREDPTTAVELANKKSAVSFGVRIVPLDLLEAPIILDHK